MYQLRIIRCGTIIAFALQRVKWYRLFRGGSSMGPGLINTIGSACRAPKILSRTPPPAFIACIFVGSLHCFQCAVNRQKSKQKKNFEQLIKYDLVVETDIVCSLVNVRRRLNTCYFCSNTCTARKRTMSHVTSI